MADKDKRGGERVPAALRIKLRYGDVETFIERYATNVSKGGIFIASRTPKPVGTLLRFEFQLADGSPVVRGEGKVIWIKEFDPARPQRPHGMGLRFTRLDGASRGLLDRILSYKARAAAAPEGSGLHPLPEDSGARPLPLEGSGPQFVPVEGSGPEVIEGSAPRPLPVEDGGARAGPVAAPPAPRPRRPLPDLPPIGPATLSPAVQPAIEELENLAYELHFSDEMMAAVVARARALAASANGEIDLDAAPAEVAAYARQSAAAALAVAAPTRPAVTPPAPPAPEPPPVEPYQLAPTTDMRLDEPEPPEPPPCEPNQLGPTVATNVHPEEDSAAAPEPPPYEPNELPPTAEMRLDDLIAATAAVPESEPPPYEPSQHAPTTETELDVSDLVEPVPPAETAPPEPPPYEPRALAPSMEIELDTSEIMEAGSTDAAAPPEPLPYEPRKIAPSMEIPLDDLEGDAPAADAAAPEAEEGSEAAAVEHEWDEAPDTRLEIDVEVDDEAAVAASGPPPASPEPATEGAQPELDVAATKPPAEPDAAAATPDGQGDDDEVPRITGFMSSVKKLFGK